MDFITQYHSEYKISLRIIRIELSPGCYENLITNLPAFEFGIRDFKDLYHLRWNEETAFRDLKYPLCLKAFHSQKYDYIVQEEPSPTRQGSNFHSASATETDKQIESIINIPQNQTKENDFFEIHKFV